MAQRVAVIWAGVIRLSVARILALKGAQVTLLDSARIGSGTSETTCAWINSNGKLPHSYHELNIAGMNEDRRLQALIPDQVRWLNESGTVAWAGEPAKAERLEQRVRSLKAKGYPAHAVEREALARLTPELIMPADEVQMWSFSNESVLCPALFVAFLRNEAIRYGVSIVEHQQISGIEEHSNGVELHWGKDSFWEGDITISAVGRPAHYWPY